MKLKQRDGTEATIEPTDEELRALIESSLDSIRRCSSVVECVVCGDRFLVNNQDLHLVTRCPAHQ